MMNKVHKNKKLLMISLIRHNMTFRREAVLLCIKIVVFRIFHLIKTMMLMKCNLFLKEKGIILFWQIQENLYFRQKVIYILYQVYMQLYMQWYLKYKPMNFNQNKKKILMIPSNKNINNIGTTVKKNPKYFNQHLMSLNSTMLVIEMNQCI
jgi:hypothetical protein